MGAVFPGYVGYLPLGVVTGPDLPPIVTNILADGIASGTTRARSSTVT